MSIGPSEIKELLDDVLSYVPLEPYGLLRLEMQQLVELLALDQEKNQSLPDLVPGSLS